MIGSCTLITENHEILSNINLGAQVTLSPDGALAELKTYEAKIRAEGVSSSFPKYGACYHFIITYSYVVRDN